MAAKKTQQALSVQPVAPTKPIDQKGFYNMPDSSASDLVLEVLGAGAGVADLPARKQQVNHSTALEVLELGQRRQVILKSQKASVTIELSDVDKLTGSNKPAKKLFVLSLIKANEQAIFDGHLTRDYVSFPLQELVDIGFYKSIRSARAGFLSGVDTLTSLKIKGHIQRNKREESAIDTLEVLFTGAKIEKNQCFIRLNYAIDWRFIAQYFTILPRYYFRLPNRASDLLYYIFYLARQHTRDIEERGYFTIGFRSIQHRLQLPSESATKNPQRDIKDPIDEAIETLETEHSSLYGSTEFRLLPVYDETSSISDYLDNGYLKVSLEGTFSTIFINISKGTTKMVEKTRKRKERITDKAIAKKTKD